MEKVLVVVAHPDDEVLGMGGTIAKLTEAGKEVNVLIVTDGCTAQYRDKPNLMQILEEKKKQTRNAMEILGVKSVIYGDLFDMKLDVTAHIEINQIIEKAINDLQPDAVFTHFWGDVNLDHRRIYESVLVAVRPVYGQIVKELYCFEVPSSTEWNVQQVITVFLPNVYVDISNVKDRKYAAFAEYHQELREYPHPRSIEYLKRRDELHGLECGIGAAERFMLLRRIVERL